MKQEANTTKYTFCTIHNKQKQQQQQQVQQQQQHQRQHQQQMPNTATTTTTTKTTTTNTPCARNTISKSFAVCEITKEDKAYPPPNPTIINKIPKEEEE